MIQQWKRVSAIEYAGKWQGELLTLTWESKNWVLYVGDKRVKEKWHTPTDAMKRVDIVQQRIIRQLVEAKAQLGFQRFDGLVELPKNEPKPFVPVHKPKFSRVAHA